MIGDQNLCPEIPFHPWLTPKEHTLIRNTIRHFLKEEGFAFPLGLVWSSQTKTMVAVECVTDSMQIIRKQYDLSDFGDSILDPPETIAALFFEHVKDVQSIWG